MPQTNSYMSIANFNNEQIHVNHRIQGNKEKIVVSYGEGMRSLAFVTPPATTFYPRLDGDGDFREGSQYGPQTKDKARFTIDLNAPWSEQEDASVQNFFNNVISAVDDAVLDFMYHNQLKFLGRKNLTKEEVEAVKRERLRREEEAQNEKSCGGESSRGRGGATEAGRV